MGNNIHDLVSNLNKKIGRSDKPSSPSVSSLGDCSSKLLLEGKSSFYVFCPKENLQSKIKEEIQNYTKRTKLHFIVTTSEYCKNNHECHGHYVDPFVVKAGDKCVFIDTFPENISGAYLHFLNRKNYLIYELVRKPGKPNHELERLQNLLRENQKPIR